VADVGAGAGGEMLGAAMRSKAGRAGEGRVEMRGQAVDLLAVEDRVALHEGDIALDFLAAVAVSVLRMRSA
jgi:hypothetical protein